MRRLLRVRSRELFNADHHEARVTPEIISLLPDLVWALDEPSDPLSACTWLLARFTRRYVKVVISGDGGDELFGGYDRYYGNLYASHYRRVPAALRRKVLAPAVALIPESGWYKSVGHQLRWLHHLSFHSGGARYAASLSYFYFDRERRAELFAPDLRPRQFGTRRRGRDPRTLRAIDGRRARSDALRRQQGAPAESPRHDHGSHLHGAQPGSAQSVHGSQAGRIRCAASLDAEGARRQPELHSAQTRRALTAPAE